MFGSGLNLALFGIWAGSGHALGVLVNLALCGIWTGSRHALGLPVVVWPCC